MFLFTKHNTGMFALTLLAGWSPIHANDLPSRHARTAQMVLEDLSAWTIIDVRDSQASSHLPLPHAIHLPLFALKTKAHLKEKQLLLVGDINIECELPQLCESLFQAGFSRVAFLLGGVRAWHQSITPLLADANALHSLFLVSEPFPQELDCRHIQLLLLAEQAPGDFDKRFPQGSWTKSLSAYPFLPHGPSDSLDSGATPYLIMDLDGSRSEALLQWALAQSRLTIYVFRGGYRHYVALSQARMEGPQTLSLTGSGKTGTTGTSSSPAKTCSCGGN